MSLKINMVLIDLPWFSGCLPNVNPGLTNPQFIHDSLPSFQRYMGLPAKYIGSIPGLTLQSASNTIIWTYQSWPKAAACSWRNPWNTMATTTGSKCFGILYRPHIDCVLWRALWYCCKGQQPTNKQQPTTNNQHPTSNIQLPCLQQMCKASIRWL